MWKQERQILQPCSPSQCKKDKGNVVAVSIGIYMRKQFRELDRITRFGMEVKGITKDRKIRIDADFYLFVVFKNSRKQNP